MKERLPTHIGERFRSGSVQRESDLVQARVDKRFAPPPVDERTIGVEQNVHPILFQPGDDFRQLAIKQRLSYSVEDHALNREKLRDQTFYLLERQNRGIFNF